MAGEASASDRGSSTSWEVEARRSEQFDQLIGQAPSWSDIVERVTSSPGMQPVTDQMLSCIASAGGPDVQSVSDLYTDWIAREAESLDDANLESIQLAKLIEQCAGDYDAVRESLLLPERQAWLADYADVLAEAELYFDEVMSEAGITVTG